MNVSLAEMVDQSRVNINRIENGDRLPSIDVLVDILCINKHSFAVFIRNRVDRSIIGTVGAEDFLLSR